jgi:hypothetical protein
MLIILYAKDRSRLLAMVEKFLKVNSPKWLKIQFNYTHHGWENVCKLSPQIGKNAFWEILKFISSLKIPGHSRTKRKNTKIPGHSRTSRTVATMYICVI